MIVQGYKLVNPLLEALGLPTTMNVTALRLSADIPGAFRVEIDCLAEKVEMGELKREIQKKKYVLVEDDDVATIIHGTGITTPMGIIDAR